MRRFVALIVILEIFCLAVGVAEDVPPLKLREVKTPWGVRVGRESYYVKDCEEFLHGPNELYSDRGGLEIAHHYAHGREDGFQRSFYDGIGVKMQESFFKAGVQQGLSRTWTPEGEVLFEGTWKDGEEWEGWFDRQASGGNGNFHSHTESWRIRQWKAGEMVEGSEKVVSCKWRSWVPGSLPDHKFFTRWRSSRFSRTDYPYINTMPPYEKVPFLIEKISKKGKSFQVAVDQLEALTRVQFGNSWQQSEQDLSEAAGKWRAWWKEVGRHRPEERTQRGVRDAKAWDLVRGGRKLPLPKRAVVIPSSYVMTVSFGTGDYAAVTSELLTIRRNGEGAELTREYARRRDDPAIKERWLPFSVEEADRVVRALGYLIDQPWLINDEEKIERLYWESEKKQSKKGVKQEKIAGRESYPELYYPGGGFELLDGTGKVWWNSDVDSWYGGNPERFNKTLGDVPGTVFPFLAKRYPESERRENGKERGWGTK